MNISCCKSYIGKEIIGLLPGGSSVPSECLWFFQPAGDVSFWTVSGESFSNDANINAILNPQGIYYSYYNTGEPGLTYYTMSFSYVGTEAPLYDLNILDSFNNPINPTWVEQCCTKTCYEIQIDGYWEDYQPQFFDFGFGNIFYNNTPYTIDNPIWEGIFKSMFGSQTVLTYVLGNPWSFKIDNAYACAIPKVYTGLTSSFVDMEPCAPPAPRCYWFAEYYSAPDNNFNSWTINGNPFDPEIYNITGDASASINPLNQITIYDSRFPWIVTDNPLSLPTIPTALDSLGNPNTPTWQQGGCELTCWELVVPKTDLQFINLYFGIPMVNFLDCQSFYNSFFGLGVQNAGQIAQLQTLYQSMFGSQVTVTSTLDANGDYIVRINNTYESFAPSWNNTTLGQLVFTQVPC